MNTATHTANNQGKRPAFFFLLWWLVWGAGQYYAMKTAGAAPRQAITDAFISMGVLAFFSLVILSNMRYYLPGREKYLYVLIVSTALGALALLINYVAETNIFRQDTLFLEIFKASLLLRFALGFLLLACVALTGLLRRTAERQAEDAYYKQETERIAKDAELNKLRLKLQPHFLFNSLNSISALTGTQPEKARQMIQQLSAFLRGTLKKEDEGFITVEEELEQLQLYFDIEKLRFGHRLSVAVSCDESLLKLELPALLLQPVVENAIKFGLYDTLEDVCISISASKKGNALEVVISNPFDESTSIAGRGTGFGLSSVRRRLFLLFGRQDLLQTRTEAGNFITVITIPQRT